MDRMKTKRERGGGKALLPALAVLAVLAFASIAIATSACSDAEDSGGAEPAGPSEAVVLTYKENGEDKTSSFDGVEAALTAAWNLRGGDNAVWDTAVVTVKESISAENIDAWKVPKLVIDADAELKCSGDIKTSSESYNTSCSVENAGRLSADEIYGELDKGGVVNKEGGTVECRRFLAAGDGWSNSGTISSDDLRLDRFTNSGDIQGRKDGAIMAVLGTPVKINDADYFGMHRWNDSEKLWKESGSIEVWKDGAKLATYNYMPDAYACAAANDAHMLKLASKMSESWSGAPDIVVKIDLTLDLNGYECSYPGKLIADSDGSLTITDSKADDGDEAHVPGTAKFGGSSGAVWVKEGGSFTMDGGRLVSSGRRPTVLVAGDVNGNTGAPGAAVAVKEGVIENTCSYSYGESYAPFNVPSAILIVGTGDSTASGPTLAVTGGEVKCDHGIAIMGSKDRGNTSIEISEGTVSSSEYPAVYQPQLGKLTVIGGEISGYTGIAVKGGNVNISGDAKVIGTGTFVQPDSIPEAWTSNPGCAVYLETGFEQPAAVAISGGSFSAVSDAPAALLYGEAGDAAIAITGGTFTSDPSDYVDKTKNNIVGLENGLYEVKDGPTKYTVTWKDWKGDILRSDEVVHGVMPAYNGTPVREADVQYTYTFDGWDPEVVVASEPATYTATFTGTLNTYTVTVKAGEHGTVDGASVEVAYGTSISIEDNKLTVGDKVFTATSDDADAQYTCAFAEWTPALGEDAIVIGNATYTANFSATVNKYTVTVKAGEHGTVGGASVEVAYGTPISIEDNKLTVGDKVFTATPDEADAHYTCAFVEWTPAVEAGTTVIEDVTYTANFSATVNKYIVTVEAGEHGTVDDTSVEVAYGTGISVDGSKLTVGETVFTATPNEADAQYTYAFVEWTPAVEAGTTVIEDVTYTANFSATGKPYKVTFIDIGRDDVVFDGSYGDKVQEPAWSKDGYGLSWRDSVFGDAVPAGEVTVPAHDAVYEAVWTAKEYKVVFHSAGDYYSQTFIFDAPAELRSAGSRAGYAFGGWAASDGGAVKYTDGQEICVRPYTKRVDLYAVWTPFVYSVSVAPAEHGSAAAAENAECGSTVTVTLSPAEGYRLASISAEPAVEFSGDGDVRTFAMPASDVVIAATFAKSLSTVTWADWDGEILETDGDVPYGEMPVYNGADPVRESTAQYSYAFSGWSPEISAVAGDATYTAVYTETVRTYIVTVLAGDHGTVDGTSVEAEYGTAISADGCRLTVGDKVFTAAPDEAYAFDKWTPAIEDGAIVAGDVTYTASFIEAGRTYAVTWKNWDGDILLEETVEEGAIPVYIGDTPAREADAQFTYAFSGWEPEVAAVSGPATYTAAFTGTLNTYTVTVLAGDHGTVDGASVEAEYGTAISADGCRLTVGDKVFTAAPDEAYIFASWTPIVEEGATVAEDVTYIANFAEAGRTYAVTWRNWNGDVLLESAVDAGAVPVYAGEAPVKEADAQYTYAFSGWSPEVVPAVGDAEYTAVFEQTVRTYTVTVAAGEHGTVDVASVEAEYGAAISADGCKLTIGDTVVTAAPDDAYAFEKWTPAVGDGATVAGDVTYVANFIEAGRTYTVTWKNWNGDVLLEETVEEGAIPVYTGDPPAREADVQYTYAFVGWDLEVVAAVGDAEYTAQFDATLNTYTVTVVAGDHGSVDIASVEAPYGTAVTADGCKLTIGDMVITATPDESYAFEKWTPAVEDGAAIVGDVTYAASFIEAGKTYTVTWKNWNGDVLFEGAVEEGAIPVYTGDAPVREADAQYTYAFSGWDPEVAAAVADVEYTAVFEQTVRTYTVTVEAGEHGSVDAASVEAEYGTAISVDGCRLTIGDTVVTATPDDAYTFEKWTPAVEDGATVAGDVTYTAVFAAEPEPEPEDEGGDGGSALLYVGIAAAAVLILALAVLLLRRRS